MRLASARAVRVLHARVCVCVRVRAIGCGRACARACVQVSLAYIAYWNDLLAPLSCTKVFANEYRQL